MADLSRYQKKVVDRYYEHRDDIMVNKLSELVGELYLAESDKKRETLWKRAETAMRNLKWKDADIAKMMTQRKPELLAAQLKEWLGKK